MSEIMHWQPWDMPDVTWGEYQQARAYLDAKIAAATGQTRTPGPARRPLSA